VVSLRFSDHSVPHGSPRLRGMVLLFPIPRDVGDSGDHGDSAPPPYTPISITKNLRDSIPGLVACELHPLGFRPWLFSASPRLRFWFSITRDVGDHGDRRSARPLPGLFPPFVANKGTSSIRRSRAPCATLGPPLGHPRVTQSQTQSQSNLLPRTGLAKG